jgi:hypothetical protein
MMMLLAFYSRRVALSHSWVMLPAPTVVLGHPAQA